MSYSLTIFKSIYDNKTHRKMELSCWDEYEVLLYNLAKSPGYKPKKDERFHPNASPLISPAIFNSGDTRKNVNVQHWGGWAALDVDEYSNGFDTTLETFSAYKFICYSSASSTKEKPKFRVVLPLSRNVQRDDIRHFWFSLSKEFNSLGDPQTKDLSRMYYVPAQYPNAYNFIVSNNTMPILDVDALLDKYSYAKEHTLKTFMSGLPDEIKKQVSDYRLAKLNNTNFKWSGINDCPFVNHRLVMEYKLLSGSGWYRKLFSIFLSTASNAMKQGYPISASELSALGKELDSITGGWYTNRCMETEAERAIVYVINNK